MNIKKINKALQEALDDDYTVITDRCIKMLEEKTESLCSYLNSTLELYKTLVSNNVVSVDKCKEIALNLRDDFDKAGAAIERGMFRIDPKYITEELSEGPMKYPVYTGEDEDDSIFTADSLDFDKWMKQHPDAKTKTLYMTVDEYTKRAKNI